MLPTRRRRILALLSSGLVGLVASVAVGIAPAHAAPLARILTLGTGSLYSAAPYINLATPANGIAKPFYFKVINSGAEPEQYKVRITPPVGVTAKLYLGATLVKNTYYTVEVKPGAAVSFKVTVAVPAGASQVQYYVPFEVRDPENNGYLDEAYAVANVAAPAAGTTSHGLYLKTGQQPYVGGDTSGMVLSSTAIRPTNIVTFTARLKNNGSQTANITLYGSTGGCNTTTTYKLGAVDITAAVLAGTYATGPLTPGQYKDVVVTIKLVSATTCEAAYWLLQASAPDGYTYVSPHVPFFST